MVAWYCIYMNRNCGNPECGDPFDVTETSDAEFCSWDCADRFYELEDENA